MHDSPNPKTSKSTLILRAETRAQQGRLELRYHLTFEGQDHALGVGSRVVLQKPDHHAFFKRIRLEFERNGQLKGVHDATQHLADLGYHLFLSLFPPELRVLLWEERNSDKSLMIVSRNLDIPFELCKLQGMQDDRTHVGPYLSEAYDFALWHPDYACPLSFPMRRMVGIFPKDSDLADIDEERQSFRAFHGKDHEVSLPEARTELIQYAFRLFVGLQVDPGFRAWPVQSRKRLPNSMRAAVRGLVRLLPVSRNEALLRMIPELDKWSGRMIVDAICHEDYHGMADVLEEVRRHPDTPERVAKLIIQHAKSRQAPREDREWPSVLKIIRPL